VPSTFGTTLPPHFLCSSAYWRARRGRAGEAAASGLADVEGHGHDEDIVRSPSLLGDSLAAAAGVRGGALVEPVAPEVEERPAVRIRNLTKVFPASGDSSGREVRAVDSL